jgi:hypothetical protein
VGRSKKEPSDILVTEPLENELVELQEENLAEEEFLLDEETVELDITAEEKTEKKSIQKKSSTKKEVKVEVSTVPTTEYLQTVDEISSSIHKNLEKVSVLLRELPNHYNTILQHNLRNSTKMAPLHRITLVFSIVASVLSGISLVFSQETRGQIYADRTHRITHTARAEKNSDLVEFSSELAKKETPQHSESEIMGDLRAELRKKKRASSRRK